MTDYEHGVLSVVDVVKDLRQSYGNVLKAETILDAIDTRLLRLKRRLKHDELRG